MQHIEVLPYGPLKTLICTLGPWVSIALGQPALGPMGPIVLAGGGLWSLWESMELHDPPCKREYSTCW